jgi:hypothetical protein
MAKRASGEERRQGQAGREGPCVARAHMVCAECRYAQLFAVQPRALCTHRGAALGGRVVFSGQPACDDVEPMQGDARTLAWCSLRHASALLRFGGVRPHLY